MGSFTDSIFTNFGLYLGRAIGGLYKALVTSIALYGCKSWTLLAETEQRIQAFEMKCYRRILNISYRDTKKMIMCDRKLKNSEENKNASYKLVE